MNFSTLDNKTLIKNNVALSPEETMMQNPSFSSGSSSATSPPILHENPNTKPVDGVWNDGMKNPFGMSDFGEEFLRNPAPLMMKMDREYMNWQQQETMQIVQTDFKASENSARRYSDNSCFVNGKNDESFAKSVERRQRRMIKNRESAARSRARKQEVYAIWNSSYRKMEVTVKGASLTCAAGPLSFLLLLLKAHLLYTAQLQAVTKLLMLTTTKDQTEAVDTEGGAGEDSDGEAAAAGGSAEDEACMYITVELEIVTSNLHTYSKSYIYTMSNQPRSFSYSRCVTLSVEKVGLAVGNTTGRQ
ncbi:hypothetical protein SASPL_137061 [Salvia splendens]|uniref:BZIP domain-containing protein n=1 Tax=Salvia splendens TaxID=180675 RepID=A0A8X8WSS2_SALSN|nr:hypothetical protein SASPL_137061 [Salvia splendens]